MALSKAAIPILKWWFPRVQEEFGARLRSITLFGGATMDDYQPWISNVDACCVLASQVTHDDVAIINNLQSGMRERFVEGHEDGRQSKYGVEGIFIPAELVGAADASHPYLNFSTKGVANASGNVPAFDRYLLAEHGLPLVGAKEAFAAPSREALVDKTKSDLRTLAVPPGDRTANPEWLAAAIIWFARNTIFWRDNYLPTKTGSLTIEIKNDSPFADAYRRALIFRVKGYEATAATNKELAEIFFEVKDPASEAVAALVG
jgi:hypothetical protein